MHVPDVSGTLLGIVTLVSCERKNYQILLMGMTPLGTLVGGCESCLPEYSISVVWLLVEQRPHPKLL